MVEIKESEYFSICVFDAEFKKIHEQVFRNNKPHYKGLPFLVGSDIYLYNTRKSGRSSLKEKAIDKFDGYRLEKI